LFDGSKNILVSLKEIGFKIALVSFNHFCLQTQGFEEFELFNLVDENTFY